MTVFACFCSVVNLCASQMPGNQSALTWSVLVSLIAKKRYKKPGQRRSALKAS